MIMNHTKITVLAGLAAIALTCIAVLIAAAVTEPGRYPLTQMGACFLCTVAVGLVAHELHAGYWCRKFESLYGLMVEMELTRTTNTIILTEKERDAAIGKFVAMSDNKWYDYLDHCRNLHEHSYNKFEQVVLKDIEMLRALKD